MYDKTQKTNAESPIGTDSATFADSAPAPKRRGNPQNLIQHQSAERRAAHAERLRRDNTNNRYALTHGLSSASAHGATFMLPCSTKTCINDYESCSKRNDDACLLLSDRQAEYFKKITAHGHIKAAPGEPDAYTAQALASELVRRDYITALLNAAPGGLQGAYTGKAPSASRLLVHLNRVEDKIQGLLDKLLLTPASRSRAGLKDTMPSDNPTRKMLDEMDAAAAEIRAGFRAENDADADADADVDAGPGPEPDASPDVDVSASADVDLEPGAGGPKNPEKSKA